MGLVVLLALMVFVPCLMQWWGTCNDIGRIAHTLAKIEDLLRRKVEPPAPPPK